MQENVFRRGSIRNVYVYQMGSFIVNSKHCMDFVSFLPCQTLKTIPHFWYWCYNQSFSCLPMHDISLKFMQTIDVNKTEKKAKKCRTKFENGNREWLKRWNEDFSTGKYILHFMTIVDRNNEAQHNATESNMTFKLYQCDCEENHHWFV